MHGKFVVHAEMAAARAAIERSGGELSALRGCTVYIARLAAKGEHYEDAMPCETCEGVLRACGLARAVYTPSGGVVGVRELGGGAAAPVGLSEAQCKWMGVSASLRACTPTEARAE